MKTPFRRSGLRLLCSFAQLYAVLKKPLFFFCFLLPCAPSVLLASLVGWKAMFFPAAMPAFCWWILLPLWFVFSCAAPALCAAAVLSMPGEHCGRCLSVFVPVCTMQLLLAFLWALLLLYRAPALLCLLTAAAAAIAALLCTGYAMRLCLGLGILWIVSGIWNTFLVFLSAAI